MIWCGFQFGVIQRMNFNPMDLVDVIAVTATCVLEEVGACPP